MNLVDCHFHLDLDSNPLFRAEEIENRQIYTIAVTNSPSVFFYTEKLAKNKKFLKPAIGLHPELAFERNKEVELFRQSINKTRFVGEIGLDNYKKSKIDYETQKKVFAEILTICADTGDKILTIHSRWAGAETIAMIGNNYPGKIIFHWFSGSLKELNLAIKAGFHFSVNHAMTQSANGRKIIQAIPNDRLLTETDGPFTKFKDVPFSPIHTDYILKELSLIKPDLGTIEQIQNQVFNNFKYLID